MIIASGDSTRQVKALANNVAVSLKEAGFEILSTEGDSGEWTLVDAGDLVVHVMLPADRDFYDIDTSGRAAKNPLPRRRAKTLARRRLNHHPSRLSYRRLYCARPTPLAPNRSSDDGGFSFEVQLSIRKRPAVEHTAFPARKIAMSYTQLTQDERYHI